MLAVPQAQAEVVASAPPPADTGPPEPREPLLLALEVEGVPLDVVLSAQESGPDVLVPLGELFRALGVAVQVKPDRGLAEGFFISEARRFRLDLGAREVRCGRQEFPWDSVGIVVHPDDIYVATRLFASWFGLELDVHRQFAVLTVRSSEPLPVQARAERARRIQRTLLRDAPDLSDARVVRMPYGLWSSPFIDQEFRSFTVRGGRQNISQLQSTTYATADLMYMEADLYLQADGMDPFPEVRGGIGRRDPEPVLLGPLHARQIRAGEVGYPGLPLIARSATGPGFLLSNFPLQRPSQFGEHSFSGRLASGWDVELYRGDALIAYQESRPDEAYQFDRVPLSFGFNEFLLVFNGPHGERREAREVFNVGPSLTPPGTLYYRLVASHGTDAIMRAQLETDFHVMGNVSGSLALATVGLDGRAHNYAAASVRGFWNHFFAGGDFAVDSAGGEVVEVGLQARSRRLGVGVRHAESAKEFVSEGFRSSLGPIASRTTGHLDGQLAAHGTVRIPLQAELTSERLDGGRSLDTWTNQVGLGFGRASLTHQMRQVVARGPGVPPYSDWQNALLLSLHLRHWSLRGALDYAPRARGGWQDAHLNAEGPAFGGIYPVMGLAHDRLVNNTRVIADLRTNQGPFGWSARAEVGTKSPLSLSLALSVGLNQEPRGGGWEPHAQPVARSGAASAQVFLDANGSGTRDAGEEPLPGVELVVNRAHSSQRTDDRGVVFLSGLPGEEKVELRLAANSLEDPLWVSQSPGLRLVSRPGHTALLDFPVVVSGEVAGTVSVRHPGGTTAAPGVTLELVDVATGKVVKQVATAYDGFFDLLAIPPGRYELRVAASQFRRFGSSFAPSRPIEIAPRGTLLEGVDLLIQPEPVSDNGR